MVAGEKAAAVVMVTGERADLGMAVLR